MEVTAATPLPLGQLDVGIASIFVTLSRDLQCKKPEEKYGKVKGRSCLFCVHLYTCYRIVKYMVYLLIVITIIYEANIVIFYVFLKKKKKKRGQFLATLEKNRSTKLMMI